MDTVYTLESTCECEEQKVWHFHKSVIQHVLNVNSKRLPLLWCLENLSGYTIYDVPTF